MSDRETIPLPGGYGMRRDAEKRLWSIVLPGHKWVATDFLDADARAFAAALSPASPPRAEDVDGLADAGDAGDAYDAGFHAGHAAGKKDAPHFGGVMPDQVVLPCDVWLPPATRIAKGCTLSALMTALDQRARGDGWTYKMTEAALAKITASARQDGAAGQGVRGPGAVPKDDLAFIDIMLTSWFGPEVWNQTDQRIRTERRKMGEVLNALRAAAPTPAATPSGPAAVAVEGVERLARLALSVGDAAWSMMNDAGLDEVDDKTSVLDVFTCDREAVDQAFRDCEEEPKIEDDCDRVGWVNVRDKLLAAIRRLASPQDHGAVRDAQDLKLFDPADDEAIDWVTINCMAIRRDNGAMEYPLKAMVRAYQAGKACALKTNTDKPGREGEGSEQCFACGEVLQPGELVLREASGGIIHRACCGPDRDSFTGEGGEPLRDNEPIPGGWPYTDQGRSESIGQICSGDVAASLMALGQCPRCGIGPEGPCPYDDAPSDAPRQDGEQGVGG